MSFYSIDDTWRKENLNFTNQQLFCCWVWGRASPRGLLISRDKIRENILKFDSMYKQLGVLQMASDMTTVEDELEEAVGEVSVRVLLFISFSLANQSINR